MKVALKNKVTGEVKSIKVGWSWTLFLFSGLFGLPLFLRKLNMWGAVFLALWLANVFATYALGDAGTIPAVLFFFVFLGLEIFVGMKGNEMTAKNLLENGWEFVEPQSPMTAAARAQWGLVAV